MVMPTVWSEQGGAARMATGRVTDCTYSANLMVLVFGGFRDFPLGPFTADERNALETFDNRPDNSGATHADTDLAIQRRYGVSMRKPPAGVWSEAELRAELSAAGKAYAVAGNYGQLPTFPLNLRRWDPSFTDAHDVCIIPLGDGRVRWLDPLAPMGFAGDVIEVDTVLRYAFIPNDARWLQENELAGVAPDTAMPQEDEMTWLPNFKPVPPFIAVSREGAVLFKGPGRDYPEHFKPPAGSRFHVVGVVDRTNDPVAQKPEVNSAGLWFLAAQPNFARPPGFFIPQSGIAAQEPIRNG
jgi:hypothetical protein